MQLNTVVFVPLKGEARRRRAGRMLALQRNRPKGDCAVARHFLCAFVFVFVFNFLLFSISVPEASVSHIQEKFDWPFDQNKDRSVENPTTRKARSWLPFKSADGGNGQ